MQQHLVTLRMHTYKVQEAVMAHSWSPHLTVNACVPQGSPTKQSVHLGWDCPELDPLWRETSLTQRESSSGKERCMQERASWCWRTLLLLVSVRGHWRAHFAGSSAGTQQYLFPLGCSPLMSFSPLLIGFTLGCNLNGGPWQAALDVIMS
jgi:hypothetical protein